ELAAVRLLLAQGLLKLLGGNQFLLEEKLTYANGHESSTLPNVTKIVKYDLKRQSQPNAPAARRLIRSARHLTIHIGGQAPLPSNRHASPSAQQRFFAADEVSTHARAEAEHPLRCPDFTPNCHLPLLAGRRHSCRQIRINCYRTR